MKRAWGNDRIPGKEPDADVRRKGMSMNEYLKNLDRIEFVVTLACTGRCRHCQEGDHEAWGEHVDAEIAAEAIRKIAGKYAIASLMTFGGESLLFPEAVCTIHRTAAAAGIEKRQLITNGCFSGDPERIGEVADDLAESGVNDLLLSVDAFHQETIPLEPVKRFAEHALSCGLPVRLCPSWLAGPEDPNPYNLRTRELLREFRSLQIPEDSGNVVFPSGNALKYLRAYFDENVTESTPYDEDPRDVRAISFSPNGDVLQGNVYETDILDILEAYRP